MADRRWWLIVAYLVATLAAQVPHDHHRAAPLAPQSRGDCDDPRPHVGDHEIAEPGDAPAHCPICLLRAQASLRPPTLEFGPDSTVAPLGTVEPPAVPAPLAHVPHARGPPDPAPIA